MKIKIKKLNSKAKIPTYAKGGDAGMDIYASEKRVLQPGEIASIQTGIAVELPRGYVGLIWDKSGISHKNGLKTLGGVLDSGYRGEILVGFANLSKKPYIIQSGDKIVQMLIQKYEKAEFSLVDELSKSDREIGRFGSTGTR